MGFKELSTSELMQWHLLKKSFNVLDIRSKKDRAEWQITNSIHLDVYEDLKIGKTDSLGEISLDVSVPVVVYCGSGALSKVAAEYLTSVGYDAFSLTGGLKQWNFEFDLAEIVNPNIKIIQVRRVAKGCLSYIIGVGNEAMVVDASLDSEIYIQIAEKQNWKIKYTTDTHIHADYVSRSRDLALQLGIPFLLNAEAKVAYDFEPILNNQQIPLGNLAISALHTPGHTYESTSYLLTNKYLFTGDTLFVDSVGRPDLKATENEMFLKANALYDSIRRLLAFDDEVQILPAHYGQSLEVGQLFITSTLEEIKKNVPLIALEREAFISKILANLPPTPPNYLVIAEINKTGRLGEMKLTDLEAGANRCAV